MQDDVVLDCHFERVADAAQPPYTVDVGENELICYETDNFRRHRTERRLSWHRGERWILGKLLESGGRQFLDGISELSDGERSIKRLLRLREDWCVVDEIQYLVWIIYIVGLRARCT